VLALPALQALNNKVSRRVGSASSTGAQVAVGVPSLPCEIDALVDGRLGPFPFLCGGGADSQGSGDAYRKDSGCGDESKSHDTPPRFSMVLNGPSLIIAAMISTICLGRSSMRWCMHTIAINEFLFISSHELSRRLWLNPGCLLEFLGRHID